MDSFDLFSTLSKRQLNLWKGCAINPKTSIINISFSMQFLLQILQVCPICDLNLWINSSYSWRKNLSLLSVQLSLLGKFQDGFVRTAVLRDLCSTHKPLTLLSLRTQLLQRHLWQKSLNSAMCFPRGVAGWAGLLFQTLVRRWSSSVFIWGFSIGWKQSEGLAGLDKLT